ncbi:MAG: hypothetical protein ACLTEH_02675 [Clostridia bacterium]
MEVRHMKNMVILKDLPSNMIEEAFVVLKGNKQIHKVVETVEQKKREENKKIKVKTEDYVVKEAELIIQEYIQEVDEKNIR